MFKPQQQLSNNFLCLFSGAILPLAFSPLDWFFCSIISVAIAFFCVRHQTKLWSAWFMGLSYGIGMFGVGVSWVYVSIHDYGDSSVFLAGVLTLLFIVFLAAVFTASMFWIYAKLNKVASYSDDNKSIYRQTFLFTSVWVIFEFFRSWFLTGFPWLLLGYSGLNKIFQGFIPIIGVYGLSFILVFVATSICALVILRGKSAYLWTILVIVKIIVVLSNIFLNDYQWTKPVKSLNIAVIQGNISQLTKWDSNYIIESIKTYENLTKLYSDNDLIVWPENALPFLVNESSVSFNYLNNLAKRKGCYLILGAPVNSQSGKIYNAMLLLGRSNGKYYKSKLVPFGEYVPFESLLRGIIDFFDLPMSNFSAGDYNQELLTLSSIKISPSICYEVVYPNYIASNAKDSNLLVNLSNDTWFGDSLGPKHHLQMARMRALETGRWMIRSTNSGITAIIDSKGDIQKRLPEFTQQVLLGKVTAVTGKTPFIILKSWPVFILCLIIIFYNIRSNIRKLLKKNIATFS